MSSAGEREMNVSGTCNTTCNTTHITHDTPYKFIHRRAQGDGRALLTDYTIESLRGKLVVSNRPQYEYRVFDSPRDFLRWRELHPPSAWTYDEVIFGDNPQKIKFDLDIDGDLAPRARSLVADVMEAISDAFVVCFGEEIDTARDICVVESETDDPTYRSYHLVVLRVVPTHHSADIFSKTVAGYLPAEYKGIIDTVNKSIQSLRMAGSVKPGGLRRLQIVSQHTFEDSVVTLTEGYKQMPSLTAQVVAPMAPVIHQWNDEDLARIIETLRGDAELHGCVFRQTRGHLFIYNRVNPAHCDICNRVHDSDGTFFGSAKHDKGVITVFRACRRRPRHYILVGEFLSAEAGEVPADEAAAKVLAVKVARWAERKLGEAVTAAALREESAYEHSDAKNIYCSDSMHDYELVPTLCVRAGMKLGKTRALVKHIDQNFPAGVARVLFLSFRQTFSANIKEKFPDFTLYSEVTGPLHQDRLIVQVESLWRVMVGTPFDLCVLDESESIVEQFSSGLLRQFGGSFAVFQWLMRYSTHVIAMDAGLSDRTYNVLNSLRGGEQVLHWNTYQSAQDDKYYFTHDHGKWLSLLYNAIDRGERMAIPTNSLSEAKALRQCITERYPGKLVQIYTSETSSAEKNRVFAAVNVHWAACDILIYTPTVSAGVSFESAHFDKIFGYFTDMSCPVETCMQMIGRIRNVATKNHYIFLQGFGGHLPTSREDIRMALCRERASLFRDYTTDLLTMFEYNREGEPQLIEGPHTVIWLENLRVRNLSKNYFISRFVNWVKLAGASAYIIDQDVYAEHTGEAHDADQSAQLESECAERKKEIKTFEHGEVASARELTEDEVEKITLDMMRQKDILAADRKAFEKYKLRLDYDWYGEINAHWVSEYYNYKQRRIYRNLNRVGQRKIVDALCAIQREEREAYLTLMDTHAEGEITRKYTYDQHRIALGFISICGWESLADIRVLPSVRLYAALFSAEEKMLSVSRQVCVEFGIKPLLLVHIAPLRGDESAYLAKVTAWISKITRSMYGVRIGLVRGESNLYQLYRSTHFCTDSTPTPPSWRAAAE